MDRHCLSTDFSNQTGFGPGSDDGGAGSGSGGGGGATAAAQTFETTLDSSVDMVLCVVARCACSELDSSTADSS